MKQWHIRWWLSRIRPGCGHHASIISSCPVGNRTPESPLGRSASLSELSQLPKITLVAWNHTKILDVCQWTRPETFNCLLIAFAVIASKGPTDSYSLLDLIRFVGTTSLPLSELWKRHLAQNLLSVYGLSLTSAQNRDFYPDSRTTYYLGRLSGVLWQHFSKT